MLIYTSYFYNIRFFKPWQIPVSTAIWDPKWFHDFKGNDHVWRDRNGVWNGVRLEELSPRVCCSTQPPECVACIEEGRERNPKTCKFIQEYTEGLDRLNFQDILECLQRIADYFQRLDGYTEEPEIMLIVYEVPGNPCSERVPLQNFFRENGIEVREWENPNAKNAISKG